MSTIDVENDSYGFHHIANHLAQSILKTKREESTVTGIEGAWGTGKTHFLNLLHFALIKQKSDKTFVLRVSPWLNGNDTSLVASLLQPVDGIISSAEGRPSFPQKPVSQNREKNVSKTTSVMMEYIQATAHHPASRAPLTARTSEAPRTKTTVQLYGEVAAKMDALDLNFIILLDDLDRLEPEQVVEVMRIISAVASFPRFHYILCYDKAVLVQAIETGFAISDGEQYLHRIVPITFTLPRPESARLRQTLLAGVIRLFTDVHGNEPDEEIKKDLVRVVGTYGSEIKVFREVQMVLNDLTFRYEGIRDYVYFPDLFFLQLIQTLNPALYSWIEKYLITRAMIVSGEDHLHEEEQSEWTHTLSLCLSSFHASEARAATALCLWIPGISGKKIDNLMLFDPITDEVKALMTKYRRLGSTAYWRYYFTFSAPQQLLPADYINKLFHSAADKQSAPALAESLLSTINNHNLPSHTWFEHILSQLTPATINKHTFAECEGMLMFFFNHGDEITTRYRQKSHYVAWYDLDVNGVVDRLVEKILADDRTRAMEILLLLIKAGRSCVWIAFYIRYLIWHNIQFNHRPESRLVHMLSNDELNSIRQHFCERLMHAGTPVPAEWDLRALIRAWQDIADRESLLNWIKLHTESDKDFLAFLLRLRAPMNTIASGYRWCLNIREIGHLFDGEERLLDRLDLIELDGHFPDEIKAIRSAIDQYNKTRKHYV
ncbi:P-loop NTPase fold protein [Enterobacteriaceae bacterium ESL0689]|nr:P-loop NTPase fold protein [Enterobacteriaceae bacterium ESL0689]